MKLEQIYTGCLAHGAYYIASNGEAAIIDPLRETKPYLERAAADGVKITYIFGQGYRGQNCVWTHGKARI